MIAMKVKFYLLFFLCFTILHANAQTPGINKTSFYHALASGTKTDVESQLSAITQSGINEKEAYEGALLMRKAGLVTKAAEKLSLFKAGRLKLEAAIKKDKDNAEFSFLRLIIQEHAPKIVDYRNNINADITSIRSNFKSLPPVVQQAITDYSKKSKVLKPL